MVRIFVCLSALVCFAAGVSVHTQAAAHLAVCQPEPRCFPDSMVLRVSLSAYVGEMLLCVLACVAVSLHGWSGSPVSWCILTALHAVFAHLRVHTCFLPYLSLLSSLFSLSLFSLSLSLSLSLLSSLFSLLSSLFSLSLSCFCLPFRGSIVAFCFYLYATCNSLAHHCTHTHTHAHTRTRHTKTHTHTHTHIHTHTHTHTHTWLRGW
jgi:hypothetical protein